MRERGTMLCKIVQENEYIECFDLSKENRVQNVSIKEPVFYKAGSKRVAVIDCGCKMNISLSYWMNPFTFSLGCLYLNGAHNVS